jgi:hypothetical protein
MIAQERAGLLILGYAEVALGPRGVVVLRHVAGLGIEVADLREEFVLRGEALLELRRKVETLGRAVGLLAIAVFVERIERVA